MSFFSDRRDKKSEAIYRYKVESSWEKEKKAPRNKQGYVRRVDPVTYMRLPICTNGEQNTTGAMYIFTTMRHVLLKILTSIPKMLQLKEELVSGQTPEENQERYDRFFIFKETPKRGRKVHYNEEALQDYRKKYSGCFYISSNNIKSSQEALEMYRQKDVVENSVDDLKNRLEMKRLRVHSSPASKIRKTAKNNQMLKNLSVRDVMEQMETVTHIRLSNRYGDVYTETSPLQRHILDVFTIPLPT